MNLRQLFLQYNAQTSPTPLAIEISKAEGVYMFGPEGEKYLDLIGGISVCNVGHGNEAVKKAIHEQTENYLHVMVYGEVVQSPQVRYAEFLASLLPKPLNSIYFTNSGSEATEGAMKLAKRITGRSKIISFLNSYHGSTQGALSVMGSEYWQKPFQPLLPNIVQMEYGDPEVVKAIDDKTACIILEPVQSEAGVLVPDTEWLEAIRLRCNETGCLLIIDEIQTAFGRTGTFFRMDATGVYPDILLLGKALGGGLPMGAFIANKKHMDTLSHDPVLGHITTFGGHPLCCAAGLAAAQFLTQGEWISSVHEKEKLFHEGLQHEKIKSLSSCGLIMALEFESYDENKKIIDRCIEKGLFTDWFLFAPHCLRIAPPLTITTEEIKEACSIICACLDMD